MTKLITDYTEVKQAIANSAWAAGAVAATAVNATGFERARFIFSFGANDGTSANLLASAAVWRASTSGGTYTEDTGTRMAAVTSGVLGNDVMIIDTVTDPDAPWLKISGMTISSTAINMSCVVEMYNGIDNRPTQSAQQVVVN